MTRSNKKNRGRNKKKGKGKIAAQKEAQQQVAAEKIAVVQRAQIDEAPMETINKKKLQSHLHTLILLNYLEMLRIY